MYATWTYILPLFLLSEGASLLVGPPLMTLMPGAGRGNRKQQVTRRSLLVSSSGNTVGVGPSVPLAD